MLHCPKCKSTKLRCHQSTPRDWEGGKTRTRYCLDCNIRFNTIETVFKIPPIVKKKRRVEKPKPNPNQLRRTRTRKPLPSIEVEPDFDSMSDDELESWVFNK
tara:strand:- start:243 stop:548 length:306 start_codon:yes stop_codon:yes gene_type:complete